MAQRVVDRFEAIQVDEHGGDRQVLPPGPSQRLVEALDHESPVPQSGQPVVQRLVPDPADQERVLERNRTLCSDSTHRVAQPIGLLHAFGAMNHRDRERTERPPFGHHGNRDGGHRDLIGRKSVDPGKGGYIVCIEVGELRPEELHRREGQADPVQLGLDPL